MCGIAGKVGFNSKFIDPKFVFTVVLCLALMSSAGCGSLMHPKAGEILEQAKGASGVETQISLAMKVEDTIKTLKGQQKYEAGLDLLHNQLYALKSIGCDVTEEQAKTLAYVKATTLRKEIGTVFHRLWKEREKQDWRDLHLELLSKRMQELREALQSIKG